MSLLPVGAGLAVGFGAGWGLRAWRAHRRDGERERLFAFISHELTTPVTGIQLTLRNFLSGVFGPVPEAQRPWYQMMTDQLDAAALLIADLNDLFHLEFGGRMRLEKEEVLPSDLARDAAERLRQQAERWGLRWTVDVPPGLPALEGDAHRLGRVFRNLLGHALKFSAHGGSVRLSMEAAGAGVRATVQFDPLEAKEDEAGRVFDRFYPAQAGAHGRVLKAAGAGLSVTKEIVSRHGGSLSFERDPSGPSRFMLTLPGRGRS